LCLVFPVTPYQRTYPKGAHPDDLIEDAEHGKLDEEEVVQLKRLRTYSEDEHWEKEPVERAAKAIAAQSHRDHIKEHLYELLESVRTMENRSEQLLEVCEVAGCFSCLFVLRNRFALCCFIYSAASTTTDRAPTGGNC
jgi:hypothetical protein